RNLAHIYRFGREGVPVNDAEAVTWYQFAADREDIEAQYQLGSYYARGWSGTPPDQAKARMWWTRASDKGHAEAKKALASSGPMDARPEAERLYLAKARDGDRDAQYNLALAYANGTKGMPQDDRNAVLWYRKSAEQGHPGAQNNLGVLYSGGRGGLPH